MDSTSHVGGQQDTVHIYPHDTTFHSSVGCSPKVSRIHAYTRIYQCHTLSLRSLYYKSIRQLLAHCMVNRDPHGIVACTGEYRNSAVSSKVDRMSTWFSCWRDKALFAYLCRSNSLQARWYCKVGKHQGGIAGRKDHGSSPYSFSFSSTLHKSAAKSMGQSLVLCTCRSSSNTVAFYSLRKRSYSWDTSSYRTLRKPSSPPCLSLLPQTLDFVMNCYALLPIVAAAGLLSFLRVVYWVFRSTSSCNQDGRVYNTVGSSKYTSADKFCSGKWCTLTRQ